MGTCQKPIPLTPPPPPKGAKCGTRGKEADMRSFHFWVELHFNYLQFLFNNCWNISVMLWVHFDWVSWGIDLLSEKVTHWHYEVDLLKGKKMHCLQSLVNEQKLCWLPPSKHARKNAILLYLPCTWLSTLCKVKTCLIYLSLEQLHLQSLFAFSKSIPV